MTVRYVNPDGVSQPAGKYSHVALAQPGELAFIAGQVALAPDGSIVGVADAGSQFRQAFRNLVVILEEVGARPASVLSLTTYLVGSESLDQWRTARESVLDEYYPEGRYPPNTLLLVSGLARPEFRVEIEAVARVAG